MKTSISVMKNMADNDMIPISEFWCMAIFHASLLIRHDGMVKVFVRHYRYKKETSYLLEP